LKRNNSHHHGRKNPRGRASFAATGKLMGIYGMGYAADKAQRKAYLRARRPKAAVCAHDTPTRAYVVKALEDRWSPRQIAQRIRLDYPNSPEMWVSHETIYQAIYVQSRGGLRKVLTRQVALRSGRTRRRQQAQAGGPVRSGRPWTEGWHISTRPAEVEDRAVPGHWEGDLIMGRDSDSAIITLVERTTRFVMLGKLPGDQWTSENVVGVLTELMSRVPDFLTSTLTWDQGSEMASHARFTLASDCQVYFCDPHAPWQRGSNENTNGLLRQYFPKGVQFQDYTQDDLDAVAAQLNGRPRETLQWKNPNEALDEYLVATTN